MSQSTTRFHQLLDVAPEARALANEAALATLESIGDAVITTDTARLVTYLNPVAERMTGWTAQEARGQTLDAVLPLISEASRQPVANTAARCLEEGRSIDLEEGVLLLRRDGTEIPIGDSAAPVRDRLGEQVGVVLVIQDESEKRRVGHQLSFEASHDPLTGLINRREFERRLTRVLAGLAGRAAKHVLVSLDLDRLKIVNDTCGHAAGDELLRSIGPLFTRHLRKRDTLARLGGDEFSALLENCPLVEAKRIAENLRAEFEEYRFKWMGKVFSTGASIGLVPVVTDAGGIAAVLRAADAACYAAKAGGGNRVHVGRIGPDPAGASPAVEQRVTTLVRAIDEGQFRLFAQPIIALQAGLPARPRFEVLLRLPDHRGRLQAAAEFLPEAERYGLMPAIDRWVVGEAIAQLGNWHREHPASELPVCSINLTAAALADDSLVPVIERELTRHGIASSALCFEVSESAALANLGRTVRFLSKIRTVGCSMALEDFGSSASSFGYLKTLPVDFLKIGGHMVREVAEDAMSSSVISAINQIGRSMGMLTIAKQVESEQALRKLRAMGISHAQGRAVAPPVSLTDATGCLTMPVVPPALSAGATAASPYRLSQYASFTRNVLSG